MSGGLSLHTPENSGHKLKLYSLSALNPKGQSIFFFSGALLKNHNGHSRGLVGISAASPINQWFIMVLVNTLSCKLIFIFVLQCMNFGAGVITKVILFAREIIILNLHYLIMPQIGEQEVKNRSWATFR